MDDVFGIAFCLVFWAIMFAGDPDLYDKIHKYLDSGIKMHQEALWREDKG